MIFYINIIISWFTKIYEYIYANVTNLNIVIQLSLSAIIILLSFFVKRIFNRSYFTKVGASDDKYSGILKFVQTVIQPFSVLLALLILKQLLIFLSYPIDLLQIFVSLACLWVIIIISTYYIPNSAVKKTVLFFSMLIAVISSFGYLRKTVTLLDSLAISLSGSRISIYTVIKATLFLIIFGWIAKRVITFIQNFLSQSKSIKPSLAVLLIKLVKIMIFSVIFLLVISSVGINLKAFTILTGAIGIGIGFGLQKVVSNLISGVILLLDESVKPGDVIEVTDDFGWVKTMGARYIEVISNDGKEYLIPNEELITNRVINWSHSNNLIRLDVEVGVSYKNNPNHVKELLLEVPKKFERILTSPKPTCFMIKFGKSSIDFSLTFWINDPKNGIKEIKSDVLLAIWDQFDQNNIEIPFPQRDIYIKHWDKTETTVTEEPS